MKGEIIRVELLSTYLANWKVPTSAVTCCDDTIYVSEFPSLDPATGRVIEAPIERQPGFGCRASEDSTQGGGR